jgi:hypothetical protein
MEIMGPNVLLGGEYYGALRKQRGHKIRATWILMLRWMVVQSVS